MLKHPISQRDDVQQDATLAHRLIEHRSGASRSIAVRFRDEALTYMQLNAAANRLARYLLARGVTTESCVTVCLAPGFDAVIALLAILKAGGVYVPLEPTYPEARMRMILEDTQPKLVLTSAALVEKLPLAGLEFLRMDADEGQWGGLAGENLDTPIQLKQTAYMFYTSGSTGKPKCVMASHGNLSQYILSAQRRYGVTQHDVMPAIARFSFSISLFELLTPLVAGATVLLLERDHVVDPVRMARTLQDVSFFHAGPSLLRVVLAYVRERHTDFSPFAKVRHASSGGDMVPPELLESMKEIFSQAEVFVIYGCTEISCMGCTYPVPRERTITKTLVGKPFENVEIRILDAERHPVPGGDVGEICFAGAGVVQGYLRRSDLTAEKFIELDGQRFYCTGDMGRVNQAGEVEFLGRRDFQIQIRGMRVELEEIEYSLRNAPGVANGVVRAWPDADGEKSVAAYIVFRSGQSADVAAVRQHMAAHLADYLLPAFYIPLDALPLNHNMKLDRNALRPPQASDRGTNASLERRAPQTKLEEQLLEIWQGLLGTRDIGTDDCFADLGGDSMLVMRLILEAERRLHVTLDGTQIQRQSLRLLAAAIESSPASQDHAVRATKPGVDEDLNESRSVVDICHAFIEDMGRYAGDRKLSSRRVLRMILTIYGLQALLGYRLGQLLRAARRKWYFWPLLPLGWALYILVTAYVRLGLDIRLHSSARIGAGLFIGHLGGISLQDCRIGKQCSISQSVRIGPRAGRAGPTIGNRVWIGAHARIEGPYRVSNGSTISAAADLQQDIAENVLCMGSPARVIMSNYDNTTILNVEAASGP